MRDNNKIKNEIRMSRMAIVLCLMVILVLAISIIMGFADNQSISAPQSAVMGSVSAVLACISVKHKRLNDELNENNK